MSLSIDQILDSGEQPLANMIPDPGPNPEETCAQQERLQILEEAFQGYRWHTENLFGSTMFKE